jgi:membrane fusion protein (multidrug efflux system)
MMNSGASVIELNSFRKEKKFWQHWLFLTIFAVAGILIGVLGYYWFFYLNSHITTDDAYVETDLSPVHSRIVGFVNEVLVVENQRVQKGEVLAIFDETDLDVEFSFKKAKLDKAASDFSRATKLMRSRALSQSDYETAKANLAAMEADYKGTQLKLQYTRILSPIDGIVGKKNIQPGQFVQPGQGLFVIVPESTIWIKANYKETQLENVKAGMKVLISVDAYQHHTWEGHIESISPISGAKLSLLPPENASGNFTKIVQRIPVRIRIDSSMSKQQRLKAGMSVTTTILAGSGEN